MIVLDKEGSLHSKVRCIKGCGVGKVIEAVDTNGVVHPDVVDRLTFLAERHQHYHPNHEVEVTFYRYAELPIVREMRELREKYVKGEATK